MRSLEQLDRWITGKVKAWSARASGSPHGRELLEIRRDILADVRDHVRPKGGGKSVFPYNIIAVRLTARNTDEQALFEAAFGEGSGLEEDIRALLTEAGCPVPGGLSVTAAVLPEGDLSPSDPSFQIVYSASKSAAGSKQVRRARPNARLMVTRGKANASEYTIASDRVNIGRLTEVIGDKEGLRRRNDVAFAETETTVSREHAYLRFDVETGAFRLHDSMSRRGTSVFREGRRLEVPKGPTRGLQLRSGDEIHLGDARIAFEIQEA